MQSGIVPLLFRQLGDAQVAKAQVRGRIVPLDADVPRFQFAAGAGVVAPGAVVVPIGYLHAVDPGGQMVAVGDDGHAEPFAVLRHFLAGRLPAINGAGAVIDRGRLDLLFLHQLVGLRIVLLDDVFLRRLGRELVADLGLVAVLVFVVAAAEEDAAVEMLAVADAFELQNEVLDTCRLSADRRGRP